MAKCMPVTQRCKDELLCTRPEGLVGGCGALQRRRSGREDLSSDEHGAPRYRYMSQGIQAWCQVCCCRGVIGPEDMASPDSANEQAGQPGECRVRALLKTVEVDSRRRNGIDRQAGGRRWGRHLGDSKVRTS
ncbi:uncharacterized protein VDAG_00814 [Verticillium dahliae VdLs.17]|uniref:Uncharacterized protein n=1 Tax=Verticillium dahliae (strain VdLs.17 / ATCC MYA-4575 / FGSC 10137) TaxID=498257 RepID=G2WSI3_VERDV|nr:uncharacterized protein VDAG_00814 [Verticillium dahliae VdLs.17]EGY17132.1 hypothetical protein VDAG_00814 [Verticillium dahliae VdLs.17]KAH6701781.1 hypothetical protein EV126DRAFT_383951 [Verticillium dahliae]